MMIKLVIFAFMSIVVHKIYRYSKFMGYFDEYRHVLHWNTNANEKPIEFDDYEPEKCDRRYRNLSSDGGSLRDRRKILNIANTLDSDMLPNGLCMFSSGEFYPFVNFNNPPRRLLDDTNSQPRSSIYILDMNYLDQLKPVALDIVDSDMRPKPVDEFNLYSISIYQDEMRNFKLLGANYRPDSQTIRIDKFSLDMDRHVLVHLDSPPLRSLNIDGLCDLVVVEDHLIYFTKCFSSTNQYAEYMFDLEMRTGEVWVINLRQHVMFKVASRLFFPKSIAYMSRADVLVVTNLATDGLTLFKREPDLRLSKIADINLDSFVFDINVDVDDTLWLVTHPVLHKTIEFFAREPQLVPSRLLKLTVEIKNNRYLGGYFGREVFKTNGSLFAALGSSVYFNHYALLFSFLSDPKICFIKLN